MTVSAGFFGAPCMASSQIKEAWKQRLPRLEYSTSSSSYASSSEFCQPLYPCFSFHFHNYHKIPLNVRYIMACASSSINSIPARSTRLYVSGLSFRTTRESLRSAFEKFGQLVEVHLVMDKVANRPRGFAFLSYETEEEAKNAIEGMHGKFLDGRVIFVEVAKPRSQMGKNQQNARDSER